MALTNLVHFFLSQFWCQKYITYFHELSLRLNDIVLKPTDVYRGTEIESQGTTGDPHGSQRFKS
jgi:hypothetical protein